VFVPNLCVSVIRIFLVYNFCPLNLFVCVCLFMFVCVQYHAGHSAAPRRAVEIYRRGDLPHDARADGAGEALRAPHRAALQHEGHGQQVQVQGRAGGDPGSQSGPARVHE
jgi:hypothetical protein